MHNYPTTKLWEQIKIQYEIFIFQAEKKNFLIRECEVKSITCLTEVTKLVVCKREIQRALSHIES